VSEVPIATSSKRTGKPPTKCNSHSCRRSLRKLCRLCRLCRLCNLWRSLRTPVGHIDGRVFRRFPCRDVFRLELHRQRRYAARQVRRVRLTLVHLRRHRDRAIYLVTGVWFMQRHVRFGVITDKTQDEHNESAFRRTATSALWRVIQAPRGLESGLRSDRLRVGRRQSQDHLVCGVAQTQRETGGRSVVVNVLNVLNVVPPRPPASQRMV
jgi:hypothetical protein